MRFFTKPSGLPILGLLTVLTVAAPSRGDFVFTGQQWTGKDYGNSDFAWQYPNNPSGPGSYNTVYTQNQNVMFTGVAVDSGGNVYIATNSGEHDLLKYTPSSPTNPTVLATGVNGAEAVVLGPDGDLYAVSSNQIVKYDTTTQNQSGTAVASTGTPFVGFVGLAFDSNGKLYASESNGSIVTVDHLDGSTTTTTSFSSGGNLDNLIGGLAFLNGTLYAADGNQIYAVTSTSQTPVVTSPVAGTSYMGLAVQPGNTTDIFAAASDPGFTGPPSNVSEEGAINEINVLTGSWSVYAASSQTPGSGAGDPYNAQFLAFAPSPQIAAPEPASLTLFGIGTCVLMGYGWKRRKAADRMP